MRTRNEGACKGSFFYVTFNILETSSKHLKNKSGLKYKYKLNKKRKRRKGEKENDKNYGNK